MRRSGSLDWDPDQRSCPFAEIVNQEPIVMGRGWSQSAGSSYQRTMPVARISNASR